MKCIIVDDEPLAREGMKLNIAEVSSLELVGNFDSAITAGAFLNDNEVDLVFLDIEMPGLTGLEFIRTLKNPPLIILTTAYPQFAFEAYELDAIDYLIKPIRLPRFIKAVNKAAEYHRLRNADAGQVEDTHIFIRSDRKYVRIELSDILFIRGLKDYVIVHTSERRYSTAMNVKTIHGQLPQDQFARVSKSYIVNARHIEAFDNDTAYIGGEEIPIGKAYREAFFKDFVDGKLVDRK